jgi:hypothetical protein
VTLQQFLQLFPEFRETDAVLVTGKLDLAAARMGGPDPSVWPPFSTPTVPPASPAQPTVTDMAQANLAAHYLMTSPFGVSTLMVAPKGGKASNRTAYLDAYDELEQAVAVPFLVAGVPFV